MSWKTSGVFIQNTLNESDVAKLFRSLRFKQRRGHELVAFDIAVAADNVACKSVGWIDGWTVIFDPMLFISIEAAMGGEHPDENHLWSSRVESYFAQLSKQSVVVAFLLSGPAGTAGFALYHGGVCHRQWLKQDGKLKFQRGTPLEKESKPIEDDEQFTVQLVESLTVSFEKLSHVDFKRYTFDIEPSKWRLGWLIVKELLFERFRRKEGGSHADGGTAL